jgi:conserved protein with predicted RNA binding PUA domain
VKDLSSYDKEKVKNTLKMQFPSVDFQGLVEDKLSKIQHSRKTGRITYIYYDKQLLFSLRTSDGRFQPSYFGGKFLLENGLINQKVICSDESVEFIKAGKSLYCKHVVSVDVEIKPQSEVMVTDISGNLLAVGVAVQPGYAMLDLESGVAVKIKHYYDKHQE